MSTYFKSLYYLNASNYSNGKAHAALVSVQTSARGLARLPVKLRLMTGTYYLQSNKAAFNQNRIGPTCLVCQMEPETLEHFLLDSFIPSCLSAISLSIEFVVLHILAYMSRANLCIRLSIGIAPARM
jgi:hypothetical protein